MEEIGKVPEHLQFKTHLATEWAVGFNSLQTWEANQKEKLARTDLISKESDVHLLCRVSHHNMWRRYLLARSHLLYIYMSEAWNLIGSWVANGYCCTFLVYKRDKAQNPRKKKWRLEDKSTLVLLQ
jgi:hypothetical protein